MAAATAQRGTVYLLRVNRLPILTQLYLEEALLRNTKCNWAIINDGAFNPAIVMGISGKAQELINLPAAQASGVQVIKRFSGGGTVVVDHNTVFATLIFQGSSLPHVECYPQPVMRWTEKFYQQVFGPYGDFKLRENDYVFGDRKFGGNAQAITGQRWLHHTSLLWDYDPANMALLAQPRKAPQYREGRPHLDFLTPLSEVMPSRHDLLKRLTGAVHALDARVQEVSILEASMALHNNKLCNTKLVDLAKETEAAALAGGRQP